MGSKRKLGIGLMGLGVVGGGVAEALLKKNRVLAEEIGCRLDLRKVLVRDRAKPRAVSVDSDLLTVDPQQILASPEIDIVIEVIGGEQPALEYIRQALLNGKHVVTANKEVVAKHGSELLRMAQEKGVSILYEASVGGGIPLLLPLHRRDNELHPDQDVRRGDEFRRCTEEGPGVGICRAGRGQRH
jgi:homoserine dehydrogenase